MNNPPKKTQVPTASALLTRDNISRERWCAHCKEEHYSASCETITSVTAQREVLKKEGRCFICLNKGRRATQCRSTKRCHNCGQCHHQSLCESSSTALKSGVVPESQQATLTTAARNKTRVLLQTAQTWTYSTEESAVSV